MAIKDLSCLNIALVAESRSNYLKLGYSDEECAALTHEGEIDAVAAALQSLGHHVSLVPGLPSLVEHLATGSFKNWDLVFNMAQGFNGPAREAHVPALLEAYMIPHTFSDAATMALCQDKRNTKIVLNHYGVPSAPFAVIPKDKLSILTAMLPEYPLFVKPVTEGSSKGIDTFNKVNNDTELELAFQKLKSKFPDENILVEKFLAGRELTVSILGTGDEGRVIGIREHLFTENGPGRSENFASWKSKLSYECLLRYNDVHDMDDPQMKAASRVALDAWAALGCRDAGRVDIRFDTTEIDAIPNVLEVNPIAGLLPGHSPLPASAEVNGLAFESLLAEVLQSVLSRTATGTSARSHQQQKHQVKKEAVCDLAVSHGGGLMNGIAMDDYQAENAYAIKVDY
ncbi:hypothetical protein NLG97_g2250 [Lecanicillium saksenae]|uniref:Uncharacterized protein n=1 Tax=Lecanicillium saksenae TaxID=468837 RepID=A0ACC1R4R5_9HYPO|nr:hypothetical protein NLG97_g2250 [Lecanicillium saksenae]